MLGACSSNNNLVSSFSQRKYTKGYFNDAIGEKPAVIGIKTNKTDEKKATQMSKQIPSLEGLRGGFLIPAKQANKELSNVLSVEPKKTVQNISDLNVPYKTIPAVRDSTKTRDNASPKKIRGFAKFMGTYWGPIYLFVLLIFGALTKLTTGLVCTLCNIAFFTLLTPLGLAFLLWLFLIFYALFTGKHFW